ncbi:MAG TPA: nicotinate-nucleotide--dimethylbenzimidazole phosphoribosyltransferase [Planctomycetota bacterium]|nr:nicotinate-nucleotide--dimethylbenzimidazole phosphoribosyltransferase [Planctomycetota bacterium]
MNLEIPAPDEGARAAVARRLDAKTKPPRSLGRLEDLACAVAAIQGTDRPDVRKKAVVVMAADHGVAAAGVSAYPPEVTGQMVLNFAAGGAAICVLARQAGAEVVVVDMGCRAPVGHPGVLDRRIGPGTRDFTRGPAMSREEALRALEAGAAVAADLARRGVRLIGLGEMGIGNTTAASAMACAFLGAPAEAVTGRGTGVDDAGYARKLRAIERALEVNRPDPRDALDVLSKVGGFEIAGLAGVALGAAARRIPVLVDGLISTAAAFAAARLNPAPAACLLPSHGSVEIGHRKLLEALGTRPLLDLDLRLGEGTGAALAMTLVEAAVRILDEMATFESAGVSRR